MSINAVVYDPANPDSTVVGLALPITKDELNQNLLEENISDLSGFVVKTASFQRDFGIEIASYVSEATDLNELNYLAAKLSGLSEKDFIKFKAILEADRHQGSEGADASELADLINIIENLDAYTFHPGLDEQGYGEYSLCGPDNDVDKLISHLRQSGGSMEFEFVNLVEGLRECVDAEEFGKAMSYENGGDFLDSGYLIKDGPFHDSYHGLDDIPDDFRITDIPGNNFFKLANTDLSLLLMEMHALGGNYTQDAANNYKAFLEGDCFIIASAEKLMVLPVHKVFHSDSREHSEFLDQAMPDSRVFYKIVQEVKDDRHIGTILELPPDEVITSVEGISFGAAFVDAEFKDGTNRTFTLDEWQNLDPQEQKRIAETAYRYDPISIKVLENHLSGLRSIAEKPGKAIPVFPGDFLAWFNKPFMDKAQYPQSDMLRVAREAAKSIH